ncbi:MAG TPA: hypothetical protein VG122_18420, partial [Gemmata sp.]|nr:hypothetical protein [Gemmata sp.]
MSKLTMSLATIAALLGGGLIALPASASPEKNESGSMQVIDDAKLFSSDAIAQAEKKMSATKFDHGFHFTVDTYKELPPDRKSGYSKGMEKEKEKEFFKSWATSTVRTDKDKGPYVLICLNPGWVEVIEDKESKNRGFTPADVTHLKKIFFDAMIASARKTPDEQKAIRDKALLDATDYVINEVSGTKVVETHSSGATTTHNKNDQAKHSGSNIMSWVCIGLVVVLAIWLVIGLIRAFTGGGGGGGGGGYGGGGGGGGGFMTGLLGGMFGAMGGMWLYNHLGGASVFGGSDAYGSDGSTGDTGGDTGAGDYSDGASDGGGGDFGGGDAGGGDDTGGGGDFGGDTGGGGDFGGGG